MDDAAALARTPLHALHTRLGARMVPFAGWEMPLHYAPGVLKEHLACRAGAGLFDVSHMGQVEIRARSGRWEDAALALERLAPADILGLAPGRQRYALLTTEDGGILDDLMVANRGGWLSLVVNASRRSVDLAHLRTLGDCLVTERRDLALIALQGPSAAAALGPPADALRFMDVAEMTLLGVPCTVTRSGYTGEDGFEISLPAEAAPGFAEALLARPGVTPIGLGARDSLRLEAGLPLWGNDIDETTSPAEAALGWAVAKARRSGGRAGRFSGAARILRELEEGPARLRSGLRPEGRAPVRQGAPLFADADMEHEIGRVTSGAFGPSLDAPAAMGWLPPDRAAPGTAVFAELRGKPVPCTVAALPFVPHTYQR